MPYVHLNGYGQSPGCSFPTSGMSCNLCGGRDILVEIDFNDRKVDFSCEKCGKQELKGQ
jgi:hypothetical protein